jgi:predicted nucleic acid-binding Zn ribbon protein
MSSTKKLKDAVKKTAENLANTADSVKKATENKFSKNKKSQTFKDHKHCKICGKIISPSVEDLLCKSQNCIDRVEKDIKVKKQLRLWMILLVIALMSPNLLTALGII